VSIKTPQPHLILVALWPCIAALKIIWLGFKLPRHQIKHHYLNLESFLRTQPNNNNFVSFQQFTSHHKPEFSLVPKEPPLLPARKPLVSFLFLTPASYSAFLLR